MSARFRDPEPILSSTRKHFRTGCAEHQIAYDHNVGLGGRRGRIEDVADDSNGYWENKSFHNYADYALSASFHAGLEQLIETGRHQRSAIMCSEAVWWRCHRRLIADNLLARRETVIHIMGHGRLEKARLTAGAVIHPDGTVSYPASAHQEQRR